MLESVSCDKDEKRIFLSAEQMAQTLSNFYSTVSKVAGYQEEEDTMYDCTRILIAPNVQDAIIRAYEARGASRQQIVTCLLLSGPKASEMLAENEVVLQDGFICSRNT